MEAIDAAADQLGNTRAVCRNYYVHPFITENYENGDIVPYFKKIKRNEPIDPSSLSSAEKVMLKLISDYEIELNSKCS